MYDPSPQAIVAPKPVADLLASAKAAIATPATWCQNEFEVQQKLSRTGQRRMCSATALGEAAGVDVTTHDLAGAPDVLKDALQVFAQTARMLQGLPPIDELTADPDFAMHVVCRTNNQLDHEHLMMVFDAAISAAGG